MNLGAKVKLDNKTTATQLSQADKERINTLKKQNKQREASHAVSKVNKVYEVSTNQLAIDYLKSRGIQKIPPHFKIITGEYTNKNNEVKKAFGVGIESIGGGADIHFLKKIGDLKTMNFGEKNISFFKNAESEKIAIFESKMDYAAAYQQMNLNNVNVVIGNSTSNVDKIAELLKEENLNNVMFFNQNDAAGYKFVQKIAEKAEITTFKTMKYDILKEYKKDVNDLLLDNVKLADRIQESTLEQIQDITHSLETLQNPQNSIKITREDLKKDTELVKSNSNEQSTTKER